MLKKMTLLKKVLLINSLVLVIASTALSFVFWQAQIGSNNPGNATTPGVDVGTVEIDTNLVITGPIVQDNLLIPSGSTGLEGGASNVITFSGGLIAWTPTADTTLNGKEGALSIVFAEDVFAALPTLAAAFTVSISDGSDIVLGADAQSFEIEVIFNLEFDEVTEAMFNIINGLTFSFVVSVTANPS